jgi:hypothetical protein
MDSEALAWISIYAVLGSLSFIMPKEVHDAKKVLDFLDSLSIFVLFSSLVMKIGAFDVVGLSYTLSSLFEDSLWDFAYYSIFC